MVEVVFQEVVFGQVGEVCGLDVGDVCGGEDSNVHLRKRMMNSQELGIACERSSG